MGMDGLSIANTGAVKESTSAELTARTEQAMQADPSNTSRQVQSLSTNRRIREKEEDEEREDRERQEAASQNNPQGETFQDGLVEETAEEDTEEQVDFEDIENPNKDFYVKLNVKDDIIELYDSATDKLIETISGSELGELVQKLNMASGIFVNKKV